MSESHWTIHREVLDALDLTDREDAPRWDRVVTLAFERSVELSEILWQFRFDGARLDLLGETLKMGAGTMGPSYAREAQRWLMPFRELVTEVLHTAAVPEIAAQQHPLAVG